MRFRHVSSSLLALALVVGGMLVAMPASALNSSDAPAPLIVVTNTTDCATAGCGSLRAAIDAANLETAAPTIGFAPGVTGQITLTSDLPPITRSMSITGPGSDELFVFGDGAHHAFTAVGVAGDHLEISQLSILSSVSTTGAGGAIEAGPYSLTLRDVIVYNGISGGPSATTAHGGAVHVETEGEVLIERCVFSIGAAIVGSGFDAYGGALYLVADGITIRNTEISDSLAQYEAGIHLLSSGPLVLDSVTISGNIAEQNVGGGYIAAPTSQITGLRVTGNDAMYSVAGTIIASEILSLSDSRFDHNGMLADSAPGFGGGIITAGIGTLDRITVDHNRGAAAGGLTLRGPIEMIDSTIADNIGPGLHVGASEPASTSNLSPRTTLPTGPTSISNTTVVRNLGGITMGTYGCGSIPSLAPAAPSHLLTACDLDPTTVPTASASLDHALVHGNSGDGLVDVLGTATATWSMIGTWSDGVTISTGTITEGDPQAGALHCASDLVCVAPIPTTSAAWNAGDPAFVAPPAIDQLGQPRIVDIVDIGAYENQNAIVVPAFTG